MYTKVLRPERALLLQPTERTVRWEDEGELDESEKRSKRGRPDHLSHAEAGIQPEVRVSGHSEVKFRGQTEAGARVGSLMPESGVGLWPGLDSV